ncbi:MAG: hypothetical protein ACJ8LM_15350 [Candidatus Udaeobacter sp.]
MKEKFSKRKKFTGKRFPGTYRSSRVRPGPESSQPRDTNPEYRFLQETEPVNNLPEKEHEAIKHFKHYLFDFLILFLAVVAGFFVDNLREHYVEVQKENQFIHSMITDLNDDIHDLDSTLNKRYEKQVMIDSMLWILSSPQPNQYGNQLYYYARWLPRINRMYNNDGTLLQLKNAGNLRLIRNVPARESIMKYDQQIRFWNNVQEREESLILEYYPVLMTMFDARVFEEMVRGMAISRPKNNPQLLFDDKTHINELFSRVHFIKNVNTYQIQFAQNRRADARAVVALLKREYGL